MPVLAGGLGLREVIEAFESGKEPTITELIDYEQFCGVPAHDHSPFAGAENGAAMPVPRARVVRRRSGPQHDLLAVVELVVEDPVALRRLLERDQADAELGQAFVADLAALTGADVAASSDATGDAALGGDWELEIGTGTGQQWLKNLYVRA